MMVSFKFWLSRADGFLELWAVKGVRHTSPFLA
jgi:hypothetical protein